MNGSGRCPDNEAVLILAGMAQIGLIAHETNTTAEFVLQHFDDYIDRLFPFVAATKHRRDEEQRRLLNER